MSKPHMLAGLRVLDLTNVLSGPFASLHLALLGAEVIKVENPKGGDPSRGQGPRADCREAHMGTSFLAWNVNKKSVTLNTKTPEGKALFLRMADEADVVVENFRPGVMDRLGLGYPVLSARNPRLIYCAISGYGATGPDAQNPAYDQIIQGLSGIMDLNGDARLNPLRTGFPVCDTVGGLNGAFALMAALYQRERTGEGQFIDISMLATMLPMMGWAVANLVLGGRAPVPMGNDNLTNAPSGSFRTQDGLLNIAAHTESQWCSLCDVLGLGELKDDPRFQGRELRKRNRVALDVLLEDRLLEAPTAHWAERLNQAGVPSGAILGLEEAIRQPQIRHRGLLEKTFVAGLGELEVFGLSALFEKAAGGVTSPPPELGQHNAEIFGRLGLGQADLADLKARGVV